MNSFTTEVPPFALNISKAADKISFEIPSGKQKVNVEILPDEEGPVTTGSALTENFLSYTPSGYEFNSGGKREITKPPVITFKLSLKTTFRFKANSLDVSGYGRGTTKTDIQSKNISVKFHESQHGFFVMHYITKYPLPYPSMHLNMPEAELIRVLDLYKKKFSAYTDALDRANKAAVDCIGTLPRKGYDNDLDAICWPTKPRKRSR